MQEPYRAANCFDQLRSDSSNFAEWLACLNRVLCVALNSEMLIDKSPSSINNCSPKENWAICHFINATILHKFVLCIGITLSQTTARLFFDAIKALCCPGNRVEKLKIICKLFKMLFKNGSGAPRTNNSLVLSLKQNFAMFKKLEIKAD
ncbi:hypothetical protein O181_006923 [Austropuccinia psidii MF-1]|uniref:Uncharacterized protein n=1 Tax=Austropuccinia psidii MF-1 TaxID=1389203 RepID=A0A9Q3BL54_9BASI|nr:hypothetical protein [Austropuccinia psidii MF-1]